MNRARGHFVEGVDRQTQVSPLIVEQVKTNCAAQDLRNMARHQLCRVLANAQRQLAGGQFRERNRCNAAGWCTMQHQHDDATGNQRCLAGARRRFDQQRFVEFGKNTIALDSIAQHHGSAQSGASLCCMASKPACLRP